MWRSMNSLERDYARTIPNSFRGQILQLDQPKEYRTSIRVWAVRRTDRSRKHHYKCPSGSDSKHILSWGPLKYEAPDLVHHVYIRTVCSWLQLMASNRTNPRKLHKPSRNTYVCIQVWIESILSNDDIHGGPAVVKESSDTKSWEPKDIRHTRKYQPDPWHASEFWTLPQYRNNLYWRSRQERDNRFQQDHLQPWKQSSSRNIDHEYHHRR